MRRKFFTFHSNSQMKSIYTLTLLITTCLFSRAQSITHFGTRAAVNPALYPFFHGVASGDPLTDRVILWTRITPDNTSSPVQVGWQLFADTSASAVLQSGSVSTDSSLDYTVKVDVTNLQPGTWYYYRFTYDTFYSVLGRTRTLPVGNVSNIRFAVASCQDYQNGLYNAHRHLAQRNDVDAVLFLGDYTYEDAADDDAVNGRYHEPDKKTTTVMDYRQRQSLYHLDPDLQAAHQQYPWIVVWDDHETTNNSYTDSAKNHTVNDGLWAVRKANAVKAYNEWMPVRMPDASDTFRIFRRFTWGNLADLYMIDTRLYDRDRQAGSTISVTDSLLNDSTRTMVGPVQFNWLESNMQNSTAQWQLLGQQVMMTPLIIPAGVLGSTPFVVNADQWDGYPYERQKFYDFVLNDSIKNVVVLTGDIHTAWANDLPLPGYDTSNRAASLGVEFVAPSITSGNELPPLITAPVISSLAAHVRYVELVLHGYYILDVTPQRTQADFVYVDNINSQGFSVYNQNHYCVSDGQTWLQTCTAPAQPQNNYPPLAATPPLSTGILPAAATALLSIHPNPFSQDVQVFFSTATTADLTVQIFNAQGQQVYQHFSANAEAGLHHISISTSDVPSGSYIIRVKSADTIISKSIVKRN